MSTELTIAPVQRLSLTVQETISGLNELRQLCKDALKVNLDFGVIPGTNGKNVLLLPGAQKIALYFNAAPTYSVVEKDFQNGHAEFRVTCQLVHRGNGHVIGEGLGSCSTMESKYRFRKAERVCPECSKPAIIKGKTEYGGGWLCFKKKGGCGAKFADNAEAITSQPDGKTENENIHDVRNTVLKMAKKRAIVDAALSLGCASELFTQDLEEGHDPEPEQAKPETKPEQKQPEGNGSVSTKESAARLAEYLAKLESTTDLDRLKQLARDAPVKRMTSDDVKVAYSAFQERFRKVKAEEFNPDSEPVYPGAESAEREPTEAEMPLKR